MSLDAPGIARFNCAPAQVVVVFLAATLIALGLTLPADGLASQTARQQVPNEVLAKGERLFNWGLVGHGLLLVGALVWFGRRPRNATSTSEALWTPAPLEQNSTPTPWWLLSALIAVAGVVRVIGLDSGMWVDEVVTLTDYVRLPAAELVRNYTDQNQHPLFSLLAHGSVALFGESAWALRLPAVVFGAATAVVLFGFARRVAPAPQPLLAAGLLAVSYHHVWFSQNGRGYTMLVLFALLGSWLFVENLRRPRLVLSLGYAAVMALALYTHLTAAFVVAAHGLIYLALLGRKAVRSGFSRSDWLPMAGFVLAGLFTLQLYALILPQVFGEIKSHAGEGRVGAWTSPSWGITQLVNGLQAGFGGLAGATVAAIVVGTGFVSYVRRNSLIIALLVLPCVLGLSAMVLLNRHMYPRFLFVVFPFAVLVIVRGVVVLGEWLAGLVRVHPQRRASWGVACAAAMLLVSAASLVACYRLPKQDFDGALAYVNAIRQRSEPVVAVGMAGLVTDRYYAPDMPWPTSAAELEAIRQQAPDHPTWLIVTFPDHLKAFHPDVAAVVDAAFIRERTFPGTVGGGAVLVYRAAPLRDSATRQGEP